MNYALIFTAIRQAAGLNTEPGFCLFTIPRYDLQAQTYPALIALKLKKPIPCSAQVFP